MEPDSAPLHKLGVRNGDTLIVGYKLALLPEVMTPAAEQEGNAADDTLVAGATENQKHHAEYDNHALSSDGSNDNRISVDSTTTAEVAEAAAGGGGGNAAEPTEDSADAPAPADARARNDGVDVTGGGGGGSGGGRGGGGGGGERGGGDSTPILPSGSAAGQGTENAAGGRRAWWSRRKSHGMRRPEDSDEQGRDDGSGDEGLEAAGVGVPPSASSSTTFSPDSMNARRARVAPAPEEPVRLDASAGAGQPLTTSAGRTNLAGWARWGRRRPALSVFSDGGCGGRS